MGTIEAVDAIVRPLKRVNRPGHLLETARAVYGLSGKMLGDLLNRHGI